MDDTAQIEEAEALLREAMLDGNVDTLGRLLSADTVFTNQMGARLTRADDIAAHRSGLLKIERLDPTEKALIRLLGESAIVCVTVRLAGTYDTQPFHGTFAYTRFWHRHADRQWRIEAAHCSASDDG